MIGGTIGEARYLLQPAIKRGLNPIKPGQKTRAQILYDQKRILAVTVGPVEPALVHVLAHLGQISAL